MRGHIQQTLQQLLNLARTNALSLLKLVQEYTIMFVIAEADKSTIQIQKEKNNHLEQDLV